MSYDKWVELLVVNFSSFPLKSSVLWHSSACIQSKISVADPDLGSGMEFGNSVGNTCFFLFFFFQ